MKFLEQSKTDPNSFFVVDDKDRDKATHFTINNDVFAARPIAELDEALKNAAAEKFVENVVASKETPLEAPSTLEPTTNALEHTDAEAVPLEAPQMNFDKPKPAARFDGQGEPASDNTDVLPLPQSTM